MYKWFHECTRVYYFPHEFPSMDSSLNISHMPFPLMYSCLLLPHAMPIVCNVYLEINGTAHVGIFTLIL